MKRVWDIGSFEITLREIIASITIVAIMFTIGFLIAGKIEAYQTDMNAEYYKAVHITDTDMFQYGMDTNLGNAFVYGTLQAVDTVSFPELGDSWLYAEKVEEHYNQHTRTITKTRTNANGETETYTEKEIYYSWDYYDSWEVHSEKVLFCGIEFPYEKIERPSSKYIKTDQSFLSNVRFVYYACYPEYNGTLYAQLKAGSITDHSPFYKDMTIEEALEHKTSGFGLLLFWILWVLLIVAAVIGFCYLDNRWLEN